MPAAHFKTSSPVSSWMIAVFAILLLVPLVELPRPTLITTPPWKVELLVSLSIFVFILVRPSFIWGWTRSTKFLITALCGFGAWSGLSILWSAGFGPAVHHTFLWAVYTVFLAFGFSVLRDARSVKPFCLFAALLTLLLGVLCISDFATIVDFSVSEGTLRIRWAKYAELLVTLLPFVWGAAWFVRGKRRIVVLALGALGWIAAMLSLSKAAFISGIVGFIILFFAVVLFSKRVHKRAAIVFALIWIALTFGFQAGSAYLSSVPATTQYISGSADAMRETTNMRIFTWAVAGRMIRESPIFGVGADNFGIAFNEGRKLYATEVQDDPNNAIGEDYLFERAHNEYLQIAAELGSVGVLFFSLAFVSLGSWLIKGILRDRGRVSPLLLGAVAGMCAFGVSSLFTSFSFRAFQNGIVFFAMASVAIYLNSKSSLDQERRHSKGMSIAAWAATFGLLLFSILIGLSQIFSTLGERQLTSEGARGYFEKALFTYPENGGTQLSFASVEAKDGNFRRASELIRRSIANGVGASIAYARLSEYEEKAGSDAGALQALEDGISVFPRSMYLRASLALLLERKGLWAQAATAMDKARAIDRKQANGWYAIIKLGSKDAYQVSRSDPDTAGPAELYPQNAVFQYLNEKITP